MLKVTFLNNSVNYFDLELDSLQNYLNILESPSKFLVLKCDNKEIVVNKDHILSLEFASNEKRRKLLE
jgi:hypothetical protein